MKVLVACEYSGRVRDAFIRLGHDAMSCDLLSTETPGPHYQGDMFDLALGQFDLIIAHPPCTYLTTAAEWAYKDEQTKNIKPGTLIGAERRKAREEALSFVERIWNIPVGKLAIENPVGVINSRLPFMPKPQYVQHFQFGEDASKKTGLWLRGLPELKTTNYVEPRWVRSKGRLVARWSNQTDSGQNSLPPSADRWKDRSLTPLGLAEAMAEQWGGNVL